MSSCDSALRDVRNYDSVELASKPDVVRAALRTGRAALSEPSEITWDGYIARRERLIESGVGAVVAALTAARGRFDRIEQVGRVWIAWLDWQGHGSTPSRARHAADASQTSHGRARIRIDADTAASLIVRETWDPGWTAIARRQTGRNSARNPAFS